MPEAHTWTEGNDLVSTGSDGKGGLDSGGHKPSPKASRRGCSSLWVQSSCRAGADSSVGLARTRRSGPTLRLTYMI